MEISYYHASIFLLLALISTIISIELKIPLALVEIIIGSIAGYILSNIGFEINLNEEWLKFLSILGSVSLTFLAGAEINTDILKSKNKEVLSVGILGFLAPFLGCFLVALLILKWDIRASLITGIALSTTSVAIVYAVMYNYGLNQTEFGKGILASCFINDVATVLVLGIIFNPFNIKTMIFVLLSILIFMLLPKITNFMISRYSNKNAAFRIKWIKFILILLGGIALWAGSEAVLPAYILGMILSDIINKDPSFIKRLRSITIGLLTPMYFIKAGFLLSINVIITYPIIVLIMLLSKVFYKIIGLYLVINYFHKDKNKSWFYTLMMSTGLTFGTISAMYGLNNGIINQDQYSFLVCSVILSAVVPTIIANTIFLPKFIKGVNKSS